MLVVLTPPTCYVMMDVGVDCDKVDGDTSHSCWEREEVVIDFPCVATVDAAGAAWLRDGVKPQAVVLLKFAVMESACVKEQGTRRDIPKRVWWRSVTG